MAMTRILSPGVAIALLLGTVSMHGQTPPADCGDGVDNRPVLLVRSFTPANPTTGAPAAAGAWFAAGVIAPNWIKYRSKL